MSTQEPAVQGWRRTMYVLFGVQFSSSTGFDLLVPFLPLYVSVVGVSTVGSVELWAGLVYTAPAISLVFAAPLWGLAADRFGRRLMLLRSTFCGALLVTLMGFVQNAEQLIGLRVLQGALTGNAAAASALLAAAVPRQHVGEAFGLVKTGMRLGLGAGSLLGGVLGYTLGFRPAFWIAGALLAVAGCLTLLVREQFSPPVKPKVRVGLMASYRALMAAPRMGRVFALSFLLSAARLAMLPIVPLFLLQLSEGAGRAAVYAGVAVGAKALIGGGLALFIGKLSDRIGHGRVVIVGALGLAALTFPIGFATASWQVVALFVAAGIAGVGVMPGVSALMATHLPEGRHGATFGLDKMLSGVAKIISPLLGVALTMLAGPAAAFGMVGLIYVAVALLARPLALSGAPTTSAG